MESIGGCSWCLVSANAAASSPLVCVACGKKLWRDDSDWIIAIYQGRQFHRVCESHALTNAPNLLNTCREMNGKRRRTNIGVISEATTFTIIKDAHPGDEVPDAEPVSAETIDTEYADEVCVIQPDDPRAEALARIARRDKDGNLIASVHGAL